LLDASHQVEALHGLAQGLRTRPASPDDAAARAEARKLLGILGSAGALQPIADRDLRACCLTREALAAASPLADAVFALQALSAVALTLGKRSDIAARLISGEQMGAFAITEHEAGSDVAGMTTLATRRGDQWVLSGHKAFISNAGIADIYVVFAQTDPGAGKKGIAAFMVQGGAKGLSHTAQVLAEPHPLGELHLADCAAELLASPGEGLKVALATLDFVRPSVGAAACGMAARALEEAVAHVRARKQFGQALAEFQLVQDRLARMALDLEAARLMVYRAAWVKDQGADRITMEAAQAKAFATEAAQRVVDGAVQLLGGRGVLANHPVDRLYRAVRALRIYEGTTEIQHLLIAGQLLK